jgi:hypothetical protein
MRAFLSNPSADPMARHGVPGYLFCDAAVREARAILATVKADSFGPASGLRECIGDEWADAAVESLAAFIEQEF